MYCTKNQSFDVQLDGAVGLGRRAIGGEFPLCIGAADLSGSCMAMQTFKLSLHIHGGEKHKMCLTPSRTWFIDIFLHPRNPLTWSLNVPLCKA